MTAPTDPGTHPALTPPDSTVLRAGTLSWLFPRRSALVAAFLVPLLCLIALAVAANSTGMPLSQTLAGLLGTGDPGTVMIVRDFRLSQRNCPANSCVSVPTLTLCSFHPSGTAAQGSSFPQVSTCFSVPDLAHCPGLPSPRARATHAVSSTPERRSATPTPRRSNGVVAATPQPRSPLHSRRVPAVRGLMVSIARAEDLRRRVADIAEYPVPRRASPGHEDDRRR